MTRIIKIDGMSCSHCAARVEKALCEIEAVESVSVDVSGGEAVVTLKSQIDDGLIKESIEDLGFDVTEIK